VFNGDSLVATVDQQTASGNATGSPATHYIHPDHLGSTNVVTNASGTVEETLDYLPYGATRISTGQNATSRQYIGQFTDPSSLSYLQARYYDNSRGQFLSQDPIFLGDPKNQNLENPQSLNSYSYANDSPITGKDPTGKFTALASVALAGLVVALYAALVILSSASFQHAVGHATSATLNSSAQIVQSLPASHPAVNGSSFGGQQSVAPLINTGASVGGQAGVSVTPLNPIAWPNINLSKAERITLPAPEQLAGKTPAQIDQILQEKGLTGKPSRDRDGVRYDVPGQPGDQVRLMPGNPADSDPAKQVPYGRVTQNGVKSDPFPINGKPSPNP
jgi:RHS repeat-associated protein